MVESTGGATWGQGANSSTRTLLEKVGGGQAPAGTSEPCYMQMKCGAVTPPGSLPNHNNESRLLLLLCFFLGFPLRLFGLRVLNPIKMPLMSVPHGLVGLYQGKLKYFHYVSVILFLRGQG